MELMHDDAALRTLLRSDDARDVRLGLDLLAGAASPASTVELRHVAEHADPELRVRALAQLAVYGDSRARSELEALVHGLARSADPAARRAAATALGAQATVAADRRILSALVDDADPTVRSAALDAVAPADAADPDLVGRVVAALEDPRTAGSATAAVRRLGDPAVPLLGAALAREGASRRASLVRAAAAVAREHGSAVVAPALQDPDRAVVLTALEALDAAGARDAVPQEILDDVFRDAAGHGARALAARTALGGAPSPLRRALDDEVDLARRLAIAVLGIRHGAPVRAAVRVIDHADGQRRALAVEALDVLLTREEAAIALPLILRDPSPDERPAGAEQEPEEWIADIAGDPRAVWRSSWLAACARHAAGE
jgi:hypothetical protein